MALDKWRSFLCHSHKHNMYKNTLSHNTTPSMSMHYAPPHIPQCAHTYMYTHTRTHMHGHTYMYVYACTYIHYTYTHTCMYTHDTHACTHIHARMYTCTHACTQTHTRMYTHTCTLHIHKCTHREYSSITDLTVDIMFKQGSFS